jgi:hypothetical protein
MERPGALLRTKETVEGLRARYSASILRLAWRGRDGGEGGFCIRKRRFTE